MKRYLIVKTSSLGDIVQSFPALSLLKKIHPDAKIDWVVEHNAKDLLLSHPYVNRVIFFEGKKWKKHPWRSSCRKAIAHFVKELRLHRYDAIFDLQGNIKSGIITGFAKAKHKVGFDSQNVAEWPNLIATNRHVAINPTVNLRLQYCQVINGYFSLNAKYKQEPDLFLSVKPSKKIEKLFSHSLVQNKVNILVCPFSRWKNKQIPVKRLCDFLNFLSKDLDATFLFISGDENEKIAAQTLALRFPDRSIVLSGYSLVSLFLLMEKMDLIVSMDSLPLHLAGLSSKPTISFFGASNGHLYAPLGDQHLSLQGRCPHGYFFQKRCKHLRSCISGACMDDFSLDKITSKLRNWPFYKKIKEKNKTKQI